MTTKSEEHRPPSPEMPGQVFRDLAALCRKHGYNPGLIIGGSASGKSRADIFGKIRGMKNAD